MYNLVITKTKAGKFRFETDDRHVAEYHPKDSTVKNIFKRLISAGLGQDHVRSFITDRSKWLDIIVIDNKIVSYRIVGE